MPVKTSARHPAQSRQRRSRDRRRRHRTRCDAVATFDRKLAKKLRTFGLAEYF
jgi:hypothetical protein